MAQIIKKDDDQITENKNVWLEVWLSAINRGDDKSYAVQYANSAVRSFNKRFYLEKGE